MYYIKDVSLRRITQTTHARENRIDKAPTEPEYKKWGANNEKLQEND